jgi:hypothetical protein
MILCNVCRAEIVDPVEQVDRNYRIKVTQYQLPPQKKHDACDAEYAARVTGLEKV